MLQPLVNINDWHKGYNKCEFFFQTQNLGKYKKFGVLKQILIGSGHLSPLKVCGGI